MAVHPVTLDLPSELYSRVKQRAAMGAERPTEHELRAPPATSSKDCACKKKRALPPTPRVVRGRKGIFS